MSDFFAFAMEHFPYVLEGVPVTLGLWALAMTIGFFFGLVLAWSRIYGNRLSYAASTTYVEIFRGTPMLVQMFFIYLGLPEVGIIFDPFTAAVIAIGLNTAAYQAEYFRGAIQSIPAGQMAAARAMGMSDFQGLMNIVLPQALRRVIPQWSNEAILELKFTSIAFAIGVSEVTARAETIGFKTFRFLEIFLIVAVIYVVLTASVAQFLSLLERWVAVPGLSQSRS